MILQEQGKRTAVGRALRRRKALSHLLLNQHGNTLKTGRLHQLRQYRGGDVVGEIGADNGGQPLKLLLRQSVQVQLHHVARHNLHIGIGCHGLRQNREKGLVQLHGHHLSGPTGQLRRQRPNAGADLQHAAALVRPGGSGNVIGHLGVNQEILSHGFGKMESVPPQQLLNGMIVTKVHGKPAFSYRWK